MDLLKFIRGYKPRTYAVCCVTGFLTVAGSLYGQGEKLMAEELNKRVGDRQEASVFLEQGDKAYREGDFDKATVAYQQAVALLPQQALAVRELRDAAVQRFSQASVQQARVLSRTGDYQAAEKLLDAADAVGMAENDPKVELMRNKLSDPIRTNPALTPEHAANIDKVRRLLYMAEGSFDLGQFDKAMVNYEAVLRIDPYNAAARRGMERTNAQMTEAARAGYDQHRAAMMMEIDKQWELTTKASPTVPTIASPDDMIIFNQQRMAREKLKSIMVDQVDLSDATLEEAIDFLRDISRRNDSAESEASRKGIDFVVDLGAPDHPMVKKIRSQRVTLRLRSVPLKEVLQAICDLTGTDYRADDFAIVIRPRGTTDTTMMNRVFRVPPDFLTRESINADVQERDPFETDSPQGALLAKRFTAEEKLKNLGVKFPEGAVAIFNANNSQLRVRNSADQLDLIEQIASIASETEPVAVVIRSRILQIEEESLEELGYDWVMGDIMPGSEFVISGGTKGNGFTNDALAGNPLTAGVRSGASAVAPDGLDRLISRAAIPTPAGSTRSDSLGNIISSTGNIVAGASASQIERAPGILSLKQIIDGDATQMMMTGFSRAKGTDLMAMNEVITRSGQNAVIESVKEFRYPSEYEPPEIPNTVAGGGGGPVTPSAPTAFNTTKLGSILEVLAQVSPDRKFINVNVKPTLRELEGFVNYGSPIVGSTTQITPNGPIDPITGLQDFFFDTAYGLKTSNAILMPLFKTIRGNTQVAIADGSTIVIGGLLTTSQQRVNDGVPILKDLPLLGRFFKNEADSVQRKVVLIFINVELLDPAGHPYRYR